MKHRFTTDLMDILDAHSSTWGKQWKAGEPEDSHAAVTAVRKLLASIASAGNGAVRKIYTPEAMRMAAKRFKKKDLHRSRRLDIH